MPLLHQCRVDVDTTRGRKLAVLHRIKSDYEAVPYRRAVVAFLALCVVLAFVLTSCPSNRDGVPGQLAAAKEETQSAARSGALALDLWAQGRSTGNLTSVQLADARDEVATAFESIANLDTDDPDDLRRQALLSETMTEVIVTLTLASAGVRAVPEQPDPAAMGQRLAVSADTLERDYR